MEYVTLREGLKMPAVGFGLWRVPAEDTAAVVTSALANGYRGFDTAAIYGNEAGLGEAVRGTEVSRGELFLASKAWNENLRQGTVLQGFDETMARIGVDVLDLYMIHWPVPGRYVQAWKDILTLKRDGRIRAAGVSNFEPHMLDILREETGELPELVQVECHPRLTQKPLLAYCRANGIAMQAYSPLMQGGLELPEIVDIAARHGRTPAQVILRWDLQNGVSVIPRSTNLDRQRANLDVFDFMLSAEDMAQIDALNRNERLCADPNDFDF